MNVATLQTPTSAAKPRSAKEAAAIERERMKAWLDERVAAAQAEPITEVVSLTPALAGLLLERNPDNRPLSDVGLERIKRDIESGHWSFNGETVVVAKDGKLNNGQHRCQGVVAAGKPIKVIMVFGVERESRFTLDTGVARTVGHFLKMNGYHDTNALGSVANYIWQWKERSAIGTQGRETPTKSEALMVVARYQDIPESLNFVSRKGAGAITSKSMMAFTHWAIWKTAGQHAANEFLDKLIEGTELKRDNPILYCRNRLIEMRGVGRPGDKIELMFRAWNLFRRGEKATRIPILGRLPALEQ